MKLLLTSILVIALIACGESDSSGKTSKIDVDTEEMAGIPELATEFSIVGKWTYFEEGSNNVQKPILHFKEGGVLHVTQPNGKEDDGSYTYDAETGGLTMTDPRGQVMEVNTTLEGDTVLVFSWITADMPEGRMGLIKLKK